MSSMVGVDEKTYRKWVWIFVFKIADHESLVVSEMLDHDFDYQSITHFACVVFFTDYLGQLSNW